MVSGDGPRDEGARVGDEAFDEGEGNEVGSISLSGMGGDTKGLPETRMSMKRKAALYMVSISVHFGDMKSYLMISSRTMPLHLFLWDTFRFSAISTNSSAKRINSRDLAAHLYSELLSDQARVKRVCREVGIRGRYLGSLYTSLERRVSWYMLVELSRTETKKSSGPWGDIKRKGRHTGF